MIGSLVTLHGVSRADTCRLRRSWRRFAAVDGHAPRQAV